MIFFLSIKFKQSTADPCVYIRKRDDELVLILVWVDDIIISCNSNNLMIEIKGTLKARFKMKDLNINFFVGIQFDRKDGIITMNQSIYLNNILKKI